MPPVPSLPTLGSAALNGGHDIQVLRQPRGPGATGPGFSRRDSRVTASEGLIANRGVLDAQTYEPLEI